MKKRFYPTLVKDAENITQSELCQAPELTTLVALDATLMAAMSQIEFNNPEFGNPKSENCDTVEGVEEHIADSILILAGALRNTLSAYYAAIQKNCDYPKSQHDISF